MLKFRYARDIPPLQLQVRQVPLIPEILLYLFPDELPTNPLAREDFHSLLSAPPFWAFCWGGGQALARGILDGVIDVTSRRVWDFGAGSGIAGISALKAGARECIAVDTDLLAREACRLNVSLP